MYKIGQGQLRVIIWTNYDEQYPQYYMSNFIAIGPPVLEKKSVEVFLPHMGVVAMLIMWPRSANIYMAHTKLLNEHFYKTFVQISAIAGQ